LRRTGACDAQPFGASGNVQPARHSIFDTMLAQGCAFGRHLDAGRRYYSELFAAAAELAK
jgi:hypothetical protein